MKMDLKMDKVTGDVPSDHHWQPQPREQSIFQVDLHCVLRRVATLSCREHVDELATEPFLLLHREHETGYRLS